jgi:hypothetical protein
MRALLLLYVALAMHAADATWPDLPDPVGLGPRLVTIEWLRERGVRVAAGATDDQVLAAYQRHLDGPANQLADGTQDWEQANDRDAARRLRLALKESYNIDAPEGISRADAELLWRTAKDQQTDADNAAIERLKKRDSVQPRRVVAGVPAAKRAGIPDDAVERLMDPRYTGRQRGSQWCWAACISMVCSFHGVTYTQEAIVSDIKGRLRDEGGTVAEMLTAMSAGALQPNGQPLQLVPAIVRTVEDVINDLEKQQPIIVLLQPPNQTMGHAVVLTAIEVTDDNDLRFIIRDPSPNAPSRRTLTLKQFQSVYTGALRLRVVRF